VHPLSNGFTYPFFLYKTVICNNSIISHLSSFLPFFATLFCMPFNACQGQWKHCMFREGRCVLAKCTQFSPPLVVVMSHYYILLYFQSHRYSLAQAEEGKRVILIQNLFLFPAESSLHFNLSCNLFGAEICSCECRQWRDTEGVCRISAPILVCSAVCQHTYREGELLG